AEPHHRGALAPLPDRGRSARPGRPLALLLRALLVASARRSRARAGAPFQEKEQEMNDDYGTVLSPTEVCFQRLLPGPIETVWAYLTDSKKRGEWLASGPMEPRVGGKLTLRFKHSDLSPHKAPPPDRFKEIDAKGNEWSGIITEWDAPRRLAFTCEPSSEVV